MSAVARGVIEDLRRRKLLPVAVLLLCVVVALPAFMLKSAPESSTATSAEPVSSPAADGLPSPEQALSGEKPLVSLAVLDQSSNLQEFANKNPFKPLAKVSSDGASPAPTAPTAPTGGAGGTPGGGGTLGGGSPGGSSGPPGGGGGGGGDTTGGGGGTPTTPAPPANPPSGNEPGKPRPNLTYAVDLTFSSPSGLKRYRNVPRLKMLPSEASPLLIFLGLDAAGAKAVFLVDARLTDAGGEGACNPKPDECATVSLEPGEVEAFTDDQGERYAIQIDQIREITVSRASAAARRDSRRARSSVGPRVRFVAPVITDLLTGGQR